MTPSGVNPSFPTKRAAISSQSGLLTERRSFDTEIDKDYYRALRPRLSGAASLEFDQRQELTTFREGCFLEKYAMADRLYTSDEADERCSVRGASKPSLKRLRWHPWRLLCRLSGKG